MLVYSYNGMFTRVIIAALHYNENAGRIALKDGKGNDRYSVVYPRAKSGGYTLQKVLTEATYDYVDELIAEAIQLCSSGKKNLQLSIPQLSSPPPPVCSAFSRPEKDVAIAKHLSRFTSLT
ncbi:uncharacterized protein LOC117106715 [Anneissia japonica]|uniref:uncharacterized protein LOC117106715 n=1 Tax=Anneissia japonica TaxID=1529436 RepID=UPI00142574C5|nr:uncharacterized protein LOC117106715 [Anneissia japonica]